MGGKHKQAQRTKNNMKPSSSGRSAEMLGATLPKFTGFSSVVKDTGFSLPYFPLTTIDVADSSLDPNLQLVFKKMNKKDSTTKLKALQEFAELVKTSDPEVVKTILNYWPRVYTGLVTDADHKVREAAHLAHYEVVVKAKRNLAPHLKALIGPWFTAQYDTYPPAASAAVLAFEAAFPPAKVQEAIVFCEEEILLYITDNLTNQTIETLNNTKLLSQEDAEAKYERVLLTSLKGYTLYLTKVPSEQIKKSSELNAKLFSHAAFWKLAKYKVVTVKSAFFGVLSAVGQHAPFLFDCDQKVVVSVVFANLDVNEPTVLPLTWETALLIMSNVENWWQHLNVEKNFLPKIWKILREGGRGNAVSIYPYLLPLIYNLPPPVDVNTFFPSFFNNMRTGMNQKNVLSSRSESAMVTNTFLECFKYVVMKYNTDVVLCEKLVRHQLIPLLEWCLIENQAPHKMIFNQTTALVQYWCRNQSEIENYPLFLKHFWNCVEALFEGLLLNVEKNTDTSIISDLAAKQVEFLQSLKHTVKIKKQLKVKFTTDDKEQGETAGKSDLPFGCGGDYFNALHKLVLKVCEVYIRLIDEKRVKTLIEQLGNVFNDFCDSDNIFLRLRTSEHGKLSDIYWNVLYKWLKCSYLCCDAVIDLVFLLMKSLSEEEKSQVLGSLNEINNVSCLGCCISRALSFPHNEDTVIKKWLQSQHVSEFILQTVDKEIEGTCPPEWSNTLKLMFSESSSGGLFIDKQLAAETVKKIIQPLLNPDDYPLTLDSCASFASYISSILYTEKTGLEYGNDLLLALFSLSCSICKDPDTLSKDTLWEVTTAWQDILAAVVPTITKTELTSLTETFAKILDERLLSVNVAQINVERILNVVVNFGRCLQKTAPLFTSEMVLVLLNQNSLGELKEKVNELCVWSEFIGGRFCSPYTEVKCSKQKIEEEEVEIVKFFTLSYVKLKVIAEKLDEIDLDEDDEEEDADATPSFLAVFENPAEILADLLHSVCLATCFLDNYNVTKCAETIKSYRASMVETFQAILDENLRKSLNAHLKVQIFTKNWLWCRVVRFLHSEIFIEDLSEIYREFTREKLDEATKLGFLHMFQEFGDHISYEDVYGKFGHIETVIVSRCLLQHVKDVDVQVAEDFSRLQAMQPQTAFSNSFEENWAEVQKVVEIMRYCSTLLKHQTELVTSIYWDFIVILLASWTSNLIKIKPNSENSIHAELLTAITDLFIAVRQHILKTKEENPTSNIISEWENVLSQNVNLDLFASWFTLADKFSSQKQLQLLCIPFLQNFGNVVDYLEQQYIFSLTEGFPKWTKVTQLSVALLTHPVVTLQLWGYKMLQALIPGFIQVDSSALTSNKPHEKGLILEKFKDLLMQTQDITQTMLLEFKLGEDSCRVEPFTDSFTYTFAYLLLWDVVLTLCEKASTELRYQYSEWLQQADYLRNLLKNIFRLMPAEALDYTEPKKRACAELFVTKPPLKLTDCSTSETLEHMVCSVYSSAVFQLPALVRQWFSNVDTRTSQVVDHVTSAYVSPQLCSQELADIAQNETKFKNMIVKVLPSVREVVAVYTVDEAQMELVITLPVNYPLGVPDIECSRQIGGTSHRQWLKQLKMCILHQNGRIWDGLCLWNNNLDKKFDGVEECYICFAILHLGTYQLPKLCCQTCRKKFHSACLYKWFSTSNKSTCPICRNLF